MLARRLIRRVLIAVPAGLVGNWEREMRTLFALHFRIVSGADAIRGNPYVALWRLLEPEVLSTIDAFNSYPADARQRHFIRRAKEEMVRLDDSPIYPIRISDTLSFALTQGDISEQRLYDETTDYIRTY